MNIKQTILINFITLITLFTVRVSANDVVGCGGFVKSHVPIDFSKVEIKLVTRQGIIKDKTNCAPNNGYYFIPLYDKGELILELSPPPGWSFTPNQVQLNIDGKDPCSLGEDINFNFKGFGITGKVESLGSNSGPSGVNVQLISTDNSIRTTLTDSVGNFLFTPVFPGVYTITISHPRWKIHKGSLSVEVKEGNTELPSNSLTIQGYDVKGKVTSEGAPVKDTTILLFSSEDDKKNIPIDGCNKNELPNLQFKNKVLCHVQSDSLGTFNFGVIPNGNYYIIPYYADQHIYFKPDKIEFKVNHNSVELPESFEVVGFNLAGRILRAKNTPIANVKVFLNSQEVATTNKHGEYKLEKLKVGNYKLQAVADDVIFEETTIKISPDSKILPEIFPSAFKVCGSVTSDKPQIIMFSQVGSTKFVEVETTDGNFCQYLSPGKYNVQVNVNDEDKKKGLQFFPIKQSIEVTSEKISDILFSQLKADISGKVICIRSKDCENLKVILKSNFEEIVMPLKDNSYSSSNVQPGSYEVSITSNKLCWKSNKQVVNVNTAVVIIPPFVQSGYSVNIVSSHDAKLSFVTPGEKTTSKFDILRGITLLCLEKPGQYLFNLDSCHSYETNPVIYNTDSDVNEVIITAQKHSTKLSIQSSSNFGDIDINIQTERENVNKKIKYNNGNYVLDLMLDSSEIALITPHSDVLYFSPKSIQIQASDDCVDLGVKFKAVKGKLFRGKIIPPLQGVVITVESGGDEKLILESDSNGLYKFPPLNDNIQYTITASKEGYDIRGPDNDGNFNAQKLAEIIVEVIDESDSSALQGVLLSLSGDQTYRKNLQTNEDGKISFHSLSPSEYFLRPMMKEYQFEPNSQIIKIKEGQTVNVKLSGKRVAYSAYGKVSTLNGENSNTLIVVATGINNCSQYSEEASTDSEGQFRIRGLQPFCSYRISLKLDGTQNVERTAPEYIEIKNINKDEKDLNIIVFNPVGSTDILVKVTADNIEHYKSLKVQLYRENPNPTLIYTTSIDNSVGKIKEKTNGILVHVPAVPLDNKLYSLQLISTLKHNSEVIYFNANSSFKYVELYFNAKNNTSDQNIKQTPVWTLIFVITLLGGAYNLQLILDLLRDKFNFNISGLSNFIPISNSSKDSSENYYDNAQIEQIVQSINNLKKRPKPKKTN